MKKKVLLIIAAIFLLVGCSKGKEFSLDIGVTTIDSKLMNMEEIVDSTLTDAYNLDLSTMKEHVFKQNTDGDFYAIIKTDNTVEVKKQMNNYFERVKDFNSSYSPERLVILNDRLEKQLDNYLIYIVAEDASEIYKQILNELD